MLFSLKLSVNYLRPDIKGLIMNGENAAEDLLQWPFGSLVTKNVLVVLHIPRQ